MNLSAIRNRLAPSARKDLDTMWDAFKTQTKSTDLFAFSAYLHKLDLLSDSDLKTIATEASVHVTQTEAKAKIDGVGDTKHQHLGLLGKGAMGTVYLVHDPVLHRNVALKVMEPHLADDRRLVRRFYSEAQITAQLDHPSIVPIYRFMEDEAAGSLAYTMKLVQGRTFQQVLNEAREQVASKALIDDRSSIAQRVEMFLPVVDAMAYAHSKGAIHRDLKPENIMVGAHHEVLVMDWGIARRVTDKEELTDASEATVSMTTNREDGTQIGMAVGTPPYMSPEQAQGKNDELSGKSDQYTLGLILFEVVSLKRAVVGANAHATLFRASRGQKEPFAHIQKGVVLPTELAAIIAKATHYDPEKRYPGCEELAADIRRYLRDEEILAKPDTTLQRATRWISRHRELTLATVMGLVLLIGVGAVVMGLAGLITVEYNRYVAQVREEKLLQVSAVANYQAHRMDTSLKTVEGLLMGLVTMAEDVFSRPPVETKVYFDEDYVEGGTAPPDWADSKVYGEKVSLDHLDFAGWPNMPAEMRNNSAWKMAPLHRAYRSTMLRSAGEQTLALPIAEQNELLRNKGVPIIWAYGGTAEGVLSGFPGIGGYEEGYDPRTMAWFQGPQKVHGTAWSTAEPDESGMGLLVTASRAAFDDQHRFVGVMALDLEFSWFIDNLLDPKDFPVKLEAYLLDQNGMVMIQSSQKAIAKNPVDYKPGPFKYTDGWAQMKQTGAAGSMEVGDELLVWTPLQAVPWTYVLVGDTDALLGN